MKYFLDTEFLEGTQIKRFLGLPIGQGCKILDKPYRQTKPTIDLISIGIVTEDGREYYSISKDFNLKEAWNRYDLKKEYPDDTENGAVSRKVYWIRENVLKPIYDDLFMRIVSDDNMLTGDEYVCFNYKNFKKLINKYGKTNKQIAEEIKFFVQTGERLNNYYENETIVNNFYAYYADYDWVSFCWLFGKMIDLPKGFPKYCIDLKQELERLNETLGYNCDEKGNSYKLQEMLDYPKQTNEHNALADARWNKELYKFLQSL